MNNPVRKKIPVTIISSLLIITICCPFTVVSQNTKSSALNGRENRTVKKTLLDFVDPYIGSGGHGHVFVGASVPFGAVQIGPNNLHKGWDWCSGYHYSDSVLIGFSQTHLSGTGCTDLGDILLMPYTGKPRTLVRDKTPTNQTATSSYNHQNEKVTPGYYSVLLDNGVKAELTATERTGFHKYIFPAGEEAHVTINLKQGNGDEAYDTYIQQLDAYTIEGYRFSKGWVPDQQIYFTLKSNYPIEKLLVYKSDSLAGEQTLKAKDVKAVICFTETPRELLLKIGISSVSCANALGNINSEIPHWNFAKIVSEAQQKWNQQLSKIMISTKDEKAKKIFYTAFYHTMIAPYLYGDFNGEFRGHDKKIYRNNHWTNYSTFSLWDTYRCANSLYTLVQPERVNDMVNSLLSIYNQQGRLPIWPLAGGETNCMPGYSAVPVIAEAYLKGFTGFNQEEAWHAVKSSAMNDQQTGIRFVKSLRFIPADSIKEATSFAMEYAVDDAAIAAMAKKLSKQDDYTLFHERSNYYKTYFDNSIGFMRPKLANGAWRIPYNPVKSVHSVGDFTEGNGWQYTFFVPHDPHGLINLFGGDKQFLNKLDTFFSVAGDMGPHASMDITGLIGQYAHGNEPSHHIAYLYSFAGEQWKTAEKVRYILNEFYTDKTDGLIGNEDCGQMSSWYIMSAFGFYPVTPFNGIYVFGSPLFDKVSIALPLKRKFTVKAANNSKTNIYIQRVELNGQPYTKSFISYTDIMKGGLLTFYMGNRPNLAFGLLQKNRP